MTTYTVISNQDVHNNNQQIVAEDNGISKEFDIYARNLHLYKIIENKIEDNAMYVNFTSLCKESNVIMKTVVNGMKLVDHGDNIRLLFPSYYETTNWLEILKDFDSFVPFILDAKMHHWFKSVDFQNSFIKAITTIKSNDPNEIADSLSIFLGNHDHILSLSATLKAYSIVVSQYDFVRRISHDYKTSKFFTHKIPIDKFYKLCDFCEDYEDFRSNPYKAVFKDRNFGAKDDLVVFQVIDAFGGIYGLDFKTRFNGNVCWLLVKARRSGHTCIKRLKYSYSKKRKEDVFEQVAEVTVHQDIKHMKENEDFLKDICVGNLQVIRCVRSVYNKKFHTYEEEEVLCFQNIFQEEQCIAKTIRMLLNENSRQFDECKIKQGITSYENKMGFALSDEQRNAVMKSLFDNKISCINGGPGNGKSAVINSVSHFCAAHNMYYIVLAPTGKAANKVCGYTLHKLYYSMESLLQEISKKRSYKVPLFDKSTSSMRFSVLIIDESAMCEVEILAKVFKYINQFTHVILVGDKFQLPAINYGSFFENCIDAGVPTYTLTRNFRCNELVLLANAVKNQELRRNVHLLNNNDNFTFFDSRYVELDKQVSLVYDLCKKKKDILQVICPTNDAVSKINYLIHKKLGGKTYNDFLPNEKLVCKKNYYVKETDDETTILKLSKGAQCLYLKRVGDSILVNYDNTFIEVPSEYLTLAHAITVHKSQGDEWNYVFVVLDDVSCFTTRNLIYTALTRAKKHLYIYSTVDKMLKCVEQTPISRNTLLTSFLKNQVKVL